MQNVELGLSCKHIYVNPIFYEDVCQCLRIYYKILVFVISEIKVRNGGKPFVSYSFHFSLVS